MFYFVLLILVVISSFFVSFGEGKKTILVFKVITFLLLFLPVAFRYDVGRDYFSYVDLFYYLQIGGAEYIEPGYRWLNNIIANYTENPQWVLGISAFITLFFFFKGVDNKKWLIYSALFIMWCYVWYCSTVRQMISASLAFFAWRELEKKKYYVSIGSIIVAFLFHYSSLIYPVIYLICRYVKLNKTTIYIGFTIAILFSFILGDMLTQYIMPILSKTYYGGYIDSHWVEPIETNSGIGRVLRFTMYYIIVIFYPKEKIKNGEMILSLFVIYVLIDIISSQIWIINRIGRGIIFSIFPVIYYTSSIRYKYRKIVCIIVWSILIASFIAYLYNGFNECLPYDSVLFYY